MIQVKIGTSTERKTITIDENTTIRNALDANDVEYSTALVHLDSIALTARELDATFAELGVQDSCFLIAVVKANGGVRVV